MAYSLLLDENYNGAQPKDDFDDILSFISSVDNNNSTSLQVIKEDQLLKARAWGLSNNLPTMHTNYDNAKSHVTDISHTYYQQYHTHFPPTSENVATQPRTMENYYFLHNQGSDVSVLRPCVTNHDFPNTSLNVTSDNHRTTDVSSILHATNDFIHSEADGSFSHQYNSNQSIPYTFDNHRTNSNMFIKDMVHTIPDDQIKEEEAVLPVINSLNSGLVNKCTLMSFLESIRTCVVRDIPGNQQRNYNVSQTEPVGHDKCSTYTDPYSQGYQEEYGSTVLSPLSSSSCQSSITDNSTGLSHYDHNHVNSVTGHCECGRCNYCLSSELGSPGCGPETSGTLYSSINHTAKGEPKKVAEEHPHQHHKNKEFPFHCHEESCAETFKSKQGLNLHKLKKHNVGKLYKCDECEFKTPRRKDLHGHLVSQHKKLMPGMKVYECKFCSYKCVDRQRLLEHEVIHTGIKQFSCPDCGKHYTTKRGLRTHFKFHSNDRPYKCNLCEADFKVKSKLTDHLKLVHYKKGEKPFLCGYCEHRASIRGNVNQHIRNIHKGKPIVVLVSGEKKSKRTKTYNYSTVGSSEEEAVNK